MNLLLKCNSISATKAFYQEHLAFKVSNTAHGSCTVENEDGTIIFSDGEHLGNAPVCSGTIYFFLSDVDTYYESIKNKVTVLWPLQEMSYGTREFGIEDINGYRIAFAQKQG